MVKKIHIFMFLVSAVCQVANAKCLDVGRTQMAVALNAASFVDIIGIEAADCSSLKVGSPDEGVQFILSEDTRKIHSGIRSEVSVNYPFLEGEDVAYQMSVKLPENFKADEPQGRWWLIAQWHDQPDKRIGETWATFPHKSPPVAIYVESIDGVPGIGLVMHGDQKKAWFPFPLGQWLTLKVNIRWSTQEDGSINLTVIENSKTTFKLQVLGKNMNNSYQHYLKLGQYRHPDIKVLSEVAFKDLTITK